MNNKKLYIKPIISFIHINGANDFMQVSAGGQSVDTDAPITEGDASEAASKQYDLWGYQ